MHDVLQLDINGTPQAWLSVTQRMPWPGTTGTARSQFCVEAGTFARVASPRLC